ncbi:phosphonoacetaldehyde reductase [Neptunomonas qingdaonensis]|uniref:Alcohol dehydrogenase n=1 Tax=Neptunomonas qingdaonensis TaxID=1045558 RepID=A0A1I2UUB6_9GAMM|nr:phosphonoacetaldehyde reductase [Neptunomonas qingdaonensis]SFG78536.1 alcohol dehydrogenase [Neptunomonas qingdaonensis]
MTEVINQWKFHNPVKIIVGRGSRALLVNELTDKTLLIVTTLRGKKQFSEDSILAGVVKNNRITWAYSVKENPGLTDLQAEVDRLQNLKVDAIIAFGGGSAMDAAKALRMSLAVEGKSTLAELLEDTSLLAGNKQSPLYALPTTAGTGSEVTPFATVWNHEIKKKLSLAGENVFPSMAIVDAELTDNLPTNVTLSTGLDAINQAAESVWNKNANSITLALATRSLKLSLTALPLLVEGKGGYSEREQMAEASLLAGLAISHTRTALCHSISYPLTAHYGVPHGLACAFTMPEVCKLNLAADDGRFAELTQSLINISDLQALHGIFLKLNNKLDVAERVKSYITNFNDLMYLKNQMYNPSRAANNLVDIKEGDLDLILYQSWNHQK